MDAGDTHNFMLEDLTKELGVFITKKDNGFIKVVNTEAKQIVGVA